MIYPKSCLVNPPTMSITGCLRSTHDFWFSHDMIKWHTILLANYYTILCNQESVIPNKKEAAIIKYQISNSQLNLKIGRSQISRNVTAMQLKILQRGLYSHYKKSILLTMCTSKSVTSSSAVRLGNVNGSIFHSFGTHLEIKGMYGNK